MFSTRSLLLASEHFFLSAASFLANLLASQAGLVRSRSSLRRENPWAIQSSNSSSVRSPSSKPHRPLRMIDFIHWLSLHYWVSAIARASLKDDPSLQCSGCFIGNFADSLSLFRLRFIYRLFPTLFPLSFGSSGKLAGHKA